MTKKFFLKGLFAAVLSITIATIFGSSASYAEAVITRGLFTDSNDIRWEWQKTIDTDNTEEPEMVSIMFYDKPAATTTIVVPSLSDVITAASASESLNTYYVRSADQESQNEYFTTEIRRDFGSDVTKLDMTNTSKVQIMGIKPMLNPETEAELVFGENMVIGDGGSVNKTFKFSTCGRWWHLGDEQRCDRFTTMEVSAEDNIPGWKYLKLGEQVNAEAVVPGDLTYSKDTIIDENDFDENANYYFGITANTEITEDGAFSGYKLKLNGLDNVKYLGWYAFKNSTFSEYSRAVTIRDYQTAGDSVFSGTNINSVVIEGSEVFTHMFENCSDLTFANVTLNDHVETISYGAFANSNLKGDADSLTLSLGDFGAKAVLAQAFKNTGITQLDMGNVEKLGFEAFADNNIKSLDYPKTIRELEGRVFIGNSNLEDITVRFDTYQKTLPYRLSSTVGCDYDTSECNIQIKNLTILAPYGEGETVSENHGAPFLTVLPDYVYGMEYEGVLRHATFFKGNDFASENYNPESYKNVVSGSYFEGFSFENLIIGEGYEYIGNGAFFSYHHSRYEHTSLKKIQLPESLLGIGDHAFEQVINAAAENPEIYSNYYVRTHAHPDVNIPSGLIYIGDFAFYMDTALYGEFNTPNLEYLGAHSFENTNITDIYFYNSLKRIGDNPFYYYTGDGAYHANGRGHIFDGKRNVTFDSDLAVGVEIGMYRYPEVMEYGTIKYTENVQHLVPVGEDYFNVVFDKIDMGESNIKTIPYRMFIGNIVGEFILPSGLTTIEPEAFYDTEIKTELVLPETLSEIGANAFNCGFHWGSNNYHYTPEDPFSLGRPIYPDATAIITRFPQSLTKIGLGAFYGNEGVTADVDLPNLVNLAPAAFTGTSIKKIHWYPNNPGVTYAFGGNDYLEEFYLDHVPTGYSISDMVGGFKGYGGYYRHGEYVDSPEEMHHFKTVTLGENAASSTSSFYYWLNADVLDASRLNTTTIYDRMFLGVNVGELILPDNIEQINSNAFMFANIQEELILPDTIKIIRKDAFNNAPYLASVSMSNPEGDQSLSLHVPITKLPESLETVEQGAFYGAFTVTADVNSPNLKTIENGAFMKSGIRDVELHDVTTIQPGAFLYIPTLRNITIDFDLYGLSGGRSRYFYNIFSTVPIANDSDHHRQSEEKSTFGDITFTEKSVTAPNTVANFAFFTANSIDISNTKWATIPSATFFKTIVTEPMTLPETLESIGANSFQESQLTITNALPEGVKYIESAAFFRAKINDNLVIPSTVEAIRSSAFNADGVDVIYNTVTIKPATLGYVATSGEAIFQVFWNAKMDKLIVESAELPVMSTMSKDSESGLILSNTGENVCYNYGDRYQGTYCLNGAGEETPIKRKPEFHGMTMREVVLTNAKAITANAFEDCPELETVDLRTNSNLQYIGRNAFINSDKLSKVIFDDSLEGKNVGIGEYAFKNTAIETIGINNEAGFNLAAANFNTDLPVVSTDGYSMQTNTYSFAEMPALRSVSVPNNFSNKTIPAYTFANDPELAEASIAWELETIENGAFNNDTKLAKLFVWGNANINEDADLTIPEQTTIFGYSDAPSEVYANAASRDNYEGKFYALDEVLHLTTNKNYVVLTDDKEDFDKTDLKLYALRRDGVILESDNWQEYTTAYPRSTANINFEEGRGALGDDSANVAAIVYDAPKPFSAISLANQNYANVDFEFITMPSSNNPLVLINYPDGYTGNIRTATLATMTKEEEEKMLEELEVPNTGAFLEVVKTATPIVSISAIVVAGALFIVKKRH